MARITDPGGRWLFLAGAVLASLAGPRLSLAAGPKFEVVSIKPSSASGPALARPGAASITIQDYPLRNLIGAAFGLRSAEFSSGPAWISSARYNIIAKANRPASGRELWTMVRSVLEERFRLKMHREKKEFPAFNLVMVKSGKLPAAREGSCVGSDPSAIPQKAGPGKRLVAACGSILMPRIPGGSRLEGGGVRMGDLAFTLTDLLDRPVVDKTGFTGTFDLYMGFSRDGIWPIQPSDRQGQSASGAADLPTLPNIFTALRALGLKLESGKALLDYTVIDRIERPSLD